MSGLAIGVAASQNSKIGPSAATYASQASCGACPFLKTGCYAETGHAGMVTARLNRAGAMLAAGPLAALAVAKDEAAAIDAMGAAGQPLRLHVVGDCPTPEAAVTVSGAVARWRARGGGPAWTYTHSWRTVPRASWGASVAVLASCETRQDVRQAHAAGYASAVVAPLAEAEAYVTRKRMSDGTRYLWCPEQSGRARDCVSCRLCFDDQRLLRERTAIVFAAHGAGSRKVLNVIREKREGAEMEPTKQTTCNECGAAIDAAADACDACGEGRCSCGGASCP